MKCANGGGDVGVPLSTTLVEIQGRVVAAGWPAGNPEKANTARRYLVLARPMLRAGTQFPAFESPTNTMVFDPCRLPKKHALGARASASELYGSQFPYVEGPVK